MQFIKILSDTRTQFGNFFAGEIRKVEPEVAGYLIGVGWAAEAAVDTVEAPATNPAPATLEVQGVNMGVKSEVIK